MSSETYSAITNVILGASMIAMLCAGAYLVAAILGWRGPHRNRRLVRFTICLVVCPVLVAMHQALLWGVFLPSQGREAMRERQDQVDAASFVHVGDSAPPFTIKDTNGAEFALDELRGKVVLVNFFATWCGSCLEELPHVQKLWDENRDNGDFVLIVIGREETNESVAAYKSKYDYSFPMAPDPERTVYSSYAKELIPRSYLVTSDGRICFASTWSTDPDLTSLQRELAKQLQSTR